MLAQDLKRLPVGVEQNGLDLQNPFAGGLNSPQLNAVDLNQDGILDLHFFDRAGNIHLTYLNNGSTDGAAYTFAPEFAANFPELHGWALLRDYNGDGIMDMFSFSDRPGIFGIKVHQGRYENDTLKFERLQHFNGPHNLLSFLIPNGSYPNLYVTDEDLPAIDDIDGDGDMDVVTFDPGGTHVNFYKNLSVEQGHGLDSLNYRLVDDCWGDFAEAGLNADIVLSASTSVCPGLWNGQIFVDTRHSGSTLMTFDLNNDGVKELVLGDLSSNNLVQLDNGGTVTDAFMVASDITYPSNDVPVDMPIFIASFYLDVNNDGKKDFIAAPNNSRASEDDENIWFYENVNNNDFPQFEFRQKDFLVNTMIDLGTGANPAFVDYNADGLLDMVVGNTTYVLSGGQKDSRLFLFENIGSSTSPKYRLADDNWLSLNQYNSSSSYFNFSPTFGDLDSDGDLDLMVGEESGKLIYFENTAGANNPFDFAAPDLNFQEIDAGQKSNPQIIDVNRDGLPDLLVGRKIGWVVYFPNTGTAANPQFQADPFTAPNIAKFGNIDTRINNIFDGNASPNMIDVDGEYLLYCGTERGRIEIYDNIDGNLEGTFNLAYSTFGNIQEGNNTHLDFADINGNGMMDYIVGNVRGGLGFFTSDDVVSTTTFLPVKSLEIKVLPNPVTSFAYVEIEGFSEGETQIRLFNSVGQMVLQQALPYWKSGIDLSRLSAGIYFVEVLVGEKRGVTKLVKQP